MKLKFDMPDDWIKGLRNWIPSDIDINELARAMFINRCIQLRYCDEFGDPIPLPTLDFDKINIGPEFNNTTTFDYRKL